MGKPLPFSFCRQCGVTHEPGKHRARPAAGKSEAVAQSVAVLHDAGVPMFDASSGVPPIYPAPKPGELVVITVKKRGRPRTSTPEQRREYLKIKARERRARQKAAKEAKT